MKIFSKRNIIIVSLAVLAVGYGFYRYRQTNQPVSYDIIKVTRGNLAQTVEATGKIQSANDLEMRFETAGILSEIRVKENDQVKAGQILASLHAAQLNAAVAQAKANLDQTIAGSTSETIAQYEADVKKAEANLAKARADLNNLEAGLKQGLDNSYINQINTLQGALAPVETSMTDMDTVLGVENSSANNAFDLALVTMDNSSFYYSRAKSDFSAARIKINAVKSAVQTLVISSSADEIATATGKVKESLDSLATALDSAWTVLDKLDVNAPAHNLTIGTVMAKKTTLDTDKAAVTTKKTAVLTGEQTIATAKLNYQGDVGSAGASQVAQYEASVKIYEAALASAQASLAVKKAPQREVDLAPLRAALAQAVANREKTVLRAPIDGVIAKVNKKVGELVSSTDVVINFISPHFEIDVDIPETDVAKLKLNDSVVITLDAFGDDIKFSGKVASIEPASTEIQDVVYYKVKMTLDDTDKAVKSGMTANVTVSTASRENTLYIPSRAVRTNDEKYVRVLIGNEVKDMPIKLGLKADDGKIEVLSGLQEGDLVVLGVKAK